MLKNFVIFSLLLISMKAQACWKLEGTLGVDGETFKISQKVDHEKDYSLPLGTFILNFKIKQGKETKHFFSYDLQERVDSKLILTSKGKEIIEEGKSKDIYAKGEKNRPHSIISIKIFHI